jgi:PAS domain S-box-containing protein
MTDTEGSYFADLESTQIRVLHVDDEPEFADIAATFLEREDERFSVETATSASEGLDHLANTAFDCIVSDYDMPEQDGIEFLETIRGEYPELPFILYTGKGSETVASEAISAGVTDYLQKESGTSQYTVLANRIENAVRQYRSQDALEASQKRLSLFFEQSPLGVIEWDDDFDIVRANEAAERILGYTQEELAGHSWERIVPESDRDDVSEVVKKLLAADGGFHSINENVRNNGEHVICEWHNRVVTDEEGDTVAVFSQFQDVTERIDREERLQQTTARLNALFENSPVMLNVHDAAGNIIDPNPVLCEATGYTEAELTDMKVWDIDQRIDPDEAHTLWEEMTVGERRQLDGVYQRKDGSTFPTEVHIRRLDLDGEDRFMVISRDMTDHKERQQQLQQSQNLVEALSSALGDYFFIYDTDGVYLDVITGWAGGPVMYEPQELIGKSVDDVLPTESAEQVEAAITQALTTNTIQTVEYSVETKHGPYWYEGHIAPIPNGYDGTEAVLLTARDITDRRQRECALRQLQERTQQLMQTTTAKETAEVAVETAQNVLGAELSGFHLLSDDQQTLEPLAFADTVRAEFNEPPAYERGANTDPASAIVWDVFESGESLVITDTREYEGLAEMTPTRSGIISPIGDRGVFIVSSTDPSTFDETDEALVEILATSLVNALDRVEREVQLRERTQQLTTERDRLSALFEMIPEPIVQIRFDDSDPVVVGANTAFEETFGYEAAAINGRSINDVIVPSDRHTEAEQIDERVRTEGAVKQEVRRCTAEGCGDFLFRSVPVGAPGQTDEHFGIYVDISTQKTYERDLERQNERLDEFASVVSHDLRNPLNVAQGRLELLEEESDSDQIDAIRQAHNRMEALIDDILALARQGKAATELQHVVLAEMLRRCWQTVETADASLSIETEQTIRADPGRLQQLLENLIRNAVEHGGNGVTVTVGDVDGGFYVADDGTGMPEADREQLFEIGYSTSDEGTGFGLSIVKQVVEAHDWDIAVTGSADDGMRIEITNVESISE